MCDGSGSAANFDSHSRSVRPDSAPNPRGGDVSIEVGRNKKPERTIERGIRCIEGDLRKGAVYVETEYRLLHACGIAACRRCLLPFGSPRWRITCRQS